MISHRDQPSSFIHNGLAYYDRHGLQISERVARQSGRCCPSPEADLVGSGRQVRRRRRKVSKFCLVARVEPPQFCGPVAGLVPNEPCIRRGPATGHFGALGIEKGDPLAKDPDACRRMFVEDVRVLFAPSKKARRRSRARTSANLTHGATKPSALWNGGFVIMLADAPAASKEVVAGFAEAAVVQVRANDPHPGPAKHFRHRAVPAGTFPDLALKLLIFDERIRGPGRGGIEIQAIQVSRSLRSA